MANPNLIQWLYFQDISLDDVALRNQYREYVENEQWAQALQLLTANATQLQGKAWVADDINKIITGALVMESKFNASVPLYLSAALEHYQALIDNWEEQGAWNAATQYAPFNFVSYGSDLYINFVEAPAGTLPTDTSVWYNLGLQGLTGPNGYNFKMRFAWSNDEIYSANDVVAVDNQMWVALQINAGVTPGEDDSIWAALLHYEEGYVIVSTTPPTGSLVVANTVWFQPDEPLSTASESVEGAFYRYNETSSAWEQINLTVLYNALTGTDEFYPLAYDTTITIQRTQWVNKQYVTTYPWLTDQSLIEVLPVADMTSDQIALYNTMGIVVSGNTITLTATADPSVDLTIRLRVQ